MEPYQNLPLFHKGRNGPSDTPLFVLMNSCRALNTKDKTELNNLSPNRVREGAKFLNLTINYMSLSLVSANQKAALPTWISRGVKISQSCHHKDLFILNYPDGGFVTISSSQEAMQRMHPKDIV